MRNPHIDHGAAFDWGRTSRDYAQYRDLYPEEFYDRIVAAGLCIRGQDVLDLGTGTGVLPRNLYRYGARFTGVDVSPEQIAWARRLSEEKGQSIRYLVGRAEEADLAENAFDVATACQCLDYFDKAALMPALARTLRPGGRFAALYLAWLPGESDIAAQTERLVLQYNPRWTGGGMTRQPVGDAPWAAPWFTVERKEAYDLEVPFTRQTWLGRIRACRGTGAALPPQELARFEEELGRLLEQIAPESFTIPHYATMLVLRSTKTKNGEYGKE